MSKASVVDTVTLTEAIEIIICHRHYHMNKLRSSEGLIKSGKANERTQKQYNNSYKMVQKIDRVLKDIKL